MRQLLSLVLSCGGLLVLLGVPAQPAEPPLAVAADKEIQLAQQDLARIQGLVDLGALPRVRVDEAETELADAQDEEILARNMYSNLPDDTASEATVTEMVAAAQRRVDRQEARVEEYRKMLNAGVVAKANLAPLEAELTARETALDFTRTRAQLIRDLIAQKKVQTIPTNILPPIEDANVVSGSEEHYEGAGRFNEARDLPPLELAFSEKFDRPLPVSAEGETEVHREMGFDHRGRVDVAVAPSGPEGVWLREYLEARGIPYFAFSHAVPGKATGAHIHIGPGSTRLASPRQLSRRVVSHSLHSAD